MVKTAQPPPAINTARSVHKGLMSLLLFQKAASAKSPANASDSKTRGGSCRKSPSAHILDMGGKWYFPFALRAFRAGRLVTRVGRPQFAKLH
jgi:hypothetical protein